MMLTSLSRSFMILPDMTEPNFSIVMFAINTHLSNRLLLSYFLERTSKCVGCLRPPCCCLGRPCPIFERCPMLHIYTCTHSGFPEGCFGTGLDNRVRQNLPMIYRYYGITNHISTEKCTDCDIFNKKTTVGEDARVLNLLRSTHVHS